MGDHQDLWIEINENMLLCLWQHDIIPLISRNLRMGDPRIINKFNNTLHTSFVKHDIYQRIHYINNPDIHPLRTHIVRTFEILDK